MSWLKIKTNTMRRNLEVTHLRIRNFFSRTAASGSIPVIVSITSHGTRVEHLWITLESIARGAARPAKIFVWLDSALQDEKVSVQLERLRTRGVECVFVKDLGPHTKYYYAAIFASKSGLPVVTADDDCIYPPWWLQRLHDAALTTPDCIVCYRARLLEFLDGATPKAYNDWPLVSFNHVEPRVFFTGVSGVWYPLCFLRAIEEAGLAFLECCPKADDVWLNYVAAKGRFPARQVDPISWDFAQVPMTQNIALWTENQEGGNDAQIRRTYDCKTLENLSKV